MRHRAFLPRGLALAVCLPLIGCPASPELTPGRGLTTDGAGRLALDPWRVPLVEGCPTGWPLTAGPTGFECTRGDFADRNEVANLGGAPESARSRAATARVKLGELTETSTRVVQTAAYLIPAVACSPRGGIVDGGTWIELATTSTYAELWCQVVPSVGRPAWRHLSTLVFDGNPGGSRVAAHLLFRAEPGPFRTLAVARSRGEGVAKVEEASAPIPAVDEAGTYLIKLRLWSDDNPKPPRVFGARLIP